MNNKKPQARTSTDAQADLDNAQKSRDDIARKLAEASRETTDARREYDSGLRASVLSGAPEPSRATLEASLAREEALQRLDAAARQRITELRGEVSGLRHQEALAASRVAIPTLKTSAEGALCRLEEAVTLARKAERDLFGILFDSREGLKQPFPVELRGEANRVRAALRKRAEAIAKATRYALHPEYETDGEQNFGSQEAWYLASLRPPQKVHPANPREVGALVTEEDDHAVRQVRPIAIW